MKKYKNTRNHPVNFAVGGVNYSAPPGGTIQVPTSDTKDKYFQVAQADLKEIN